MVMRQTAILKKFSFSKSNLADDNLYDFESILFSF